MPCGDAVEGRSDMRSRALFTTLMLPLMAFFVTTNLIPDRFGHTQTHVEVARDGKASVIVGEDPLLIEELSDSAASLPYEDSPFGFIQGEYGEEDGKPYILDLGVHWDKFWTKEPLRIAFGPEGHLLIDFSNLDSVVRKLVLEYGINIFIPIPFYVRVDGEPTRLSPEQYRRLCESIVERYDGDGSNDMEGSPVVAYYSVGGTEMDLPHWPFRPEETAPYVKLGYDCIKAQNPNFKVILGGSGFSARAWGEGGYYDRLVYHLTGDQRCPDMIFDFHFWSSPRLYKRQVEVLDLVRQTLSRYGYGNSEIWTTEGGSWDGYVPPVSERDQAADVIRRYVYALAHGQKKLFWTRILEFDWTPDDSRIFDFTGLVNNPRNTDGKDWKKLAYYTYKKMVEVLEGSDWGEIRTIRESEGIYLYRFIKGGRSVWVAWADAATGGDLTISGISAPRVKVTVAVPPFASGAEILDDATAFDVRVERAVEGRITIPLDGDPVLVEEIE